MPGPDPSAVAATTLAAHLLTEAGSSISRARDLLFLLGWEDTWHPLERGLCLALERVNGARSLVDGHLEQIRKGEATEQSIRLIDIGRAQLEAAEP